MGGGIDPDTIKHSLAQITLRWMIRQICSAQCGIIFDEEALSRYDIDLPPPPVKSSEASSAGLADDAPDAIQPLHDGLKTNPLWWILEIIPGNFPYQDDEGRWHSNWRYMAYRILDELALTMLIYIVSTLVKAVSFLLAV